MTHKVQWQTRRFLMFNLCSFSTLSTLEKSGTVLLYLTIGLVALMVVIGILFLVYKKEMLKEYGKYSIGIGVGYSIGIIGLMAFLLFDEKVKEGDFKPEIF